MQVALFGSMLGITSQVLNKIAEMAEESMLLTVASVRRNMVKTQLRFENGDITEKEYREDMDYLRKRLEELRTEEDRR